MIIIDWFGINGGEENAFSKYHQWNQQQKKHALNFLFPDTDLGDFNLSTSNLNLHRAESQNSLANQNQSSSFVALLRDLCSNYPLLKYSLIGSVVSLSSFLTVAMIHRTVQGLFFIFSCSVLGSQGDLEFRCRFLSRYLAWFSQMMIKLLDLAVLFSSFKNLRFFFSSQRQKRIEHYQNSALN